MRVAPKPSTSTEASQKVTALLKGSTWQAVQKNTRKDRKRAAETIAEVLKVPRTEPRPITTRPITTPILMPKFARTHLDNTWEKITDDKQFGLPQRRRAGMFFVIEKTADSIMLIPVYDFKKRGGKYSREFLTYTYKKEPFLPSKNECIDDLTTIFRESFLQLTKRNVRHTTDITLPKSDSPELLSEKILKVFINSPYVDAKLALKGTDKELFLENKYAIVFPNNLSVLFRDYWTANITTKRIEKGEKVAHVNIGKTRKKENTQHDRERLEMDLNYFMSLPPTDHHHS